MDTVKVCLFGVGGGGRQQRSYVVGNDLTQVSKLFFVKLFAPYGSGMFNILILCDISSKYYYKTRRIGVNLITNGSKLPNILLKCCWVVQNKLLK